MLTYLQFVRSHRLSSIKHVDRIIVLGKDCKIVEDGTHDELVAMNGVYAESWKKHLGDSAEEEENDGEEENHDEEGDDDENSEETLINLD